MGSERRILNGCFGLSASTCCPLLFSVADPLSKGSYEPESKQP